MKKSLGKRVLKWTLWSLLALVVLILVGVTIVIHFIFTPAKLTPLVEKTAKEYLNAEVHFGNIELTFFSTFPDLEFNWTMLLLFPGHSVIVRLIASRPCRIP